MLLFVGAKVWGVWGFDQTSYFGPILAGAAAFLIAFALAFVFTADDPFDSAPEPTAPTTSASSDTSTADPPSASGSQTTDAPDEPAPTTEPTSQAVTPQGGDWQIENLPGSMDCGGGSGFPLTGDEIQLATFEVADDGTSIYIDSDDESLDLTVERTAVTSSSTTYEGSVDITALGDTPPGVEEFDLLFTMEFDSPTHALGEMTGTFTASGMTCSVSRPAEASFVGPTS